MTSQFRGDGGFSDFGTNHVLRYRKIGYKQGGGIKNRPKMQRHLWMLPYEGDRKAELEQIGSQKIYV